MDLGLRGKKAIITGGTRGIGRATVELLAAEGCDVAFCARSDADVKAAEQALARQGIRAVGGVADVADGAALKAWVEQAAKALGGIDIVVANVSAIGVALTEESWRRGFEIDVLGTVRTVEAAQPHLEKSSAGAIVAVATTAALEAFGGLRPYNAVKAAVIGYMGHLAAALAPKRIRANTVSPGTIYFPGGVWAKREKENPEIFKMALGRNPMGRMGTAEEVARAIVFLASPASSFTTGVNLVVDGCLTQRVQF
ncbi:MAG: SDR family oxidoreductase [Alphaproteobacteria bacterium]|nr:SDR family oxidoreductase [Alphaproteobacteria bacterium]